MSYIYSSDLGGDIMLNTSALAAVPVAHWNLIYIMFESCVEYYIGFAKNSF